MRKLAKILIPALLLIAIVATCSVMFTSAAAGTPAVSEGQTVVFIANQSKGDGSGRDAANAMGHGANYNTLLNSSNATEKASAYKQNAFYLALKANGSAVVNNGGAIVICGEFTINSCDGVRTSFSEFQWPTSNGTKNITITSYYNGVDYRAQGAKLIFDTSKYGINLRIKAPTTWEYLNIESKYDSSRGYGTYADGVAMISFYGNKTVIDEQVAVYTNDVRASGTKRTYYPALCAYDRNGTSKNASININTDLTINSGSWSRVFGANFGMQTSGGDKYGASTGTVNVTVNGGMIQSLSGTTLLTNKSTCNSTSTGWTFGHTGDVNITLNGGNITEVVCSNLVGVGSGKINLTISENVRGLTKVMAYDNTGSNASAAPANATVTYNKYNVDGSIVKDFVTKNALGAAHDPATEKVIYISANGTGNGSSPDKPLGHDSTYNADRNNAIETIRNGAYKKHVLYLAFQQLAATNGGKIVLVGDVAIDTAASRIPTKAGQKLSPSEFTLPNANGMVTITSVDGANDYRSNAKLIFDLDKCNTTFLDLLSPITFKELNIEHKYDPDDLNGWKTSFVIGAYGKQLVIDEGVNVTSLNADTNAPGDMFPDLMGGRRYSNSSTTNIVVKSGTWGRVILGGYGNTASNPCTVTGDATLTVDGGKIGKIYATGSEDRPYGTINGKATINLNAGEVERFYFSNAVEYPGTGSVVTLGSALKIKFADYAVKGYKGNLEELKTKVTFVNNTDLVIGQEPPREPDVIYVSDNGTGDGSSPDKPLGTKPGNVVANDSYVDTAFYKAVEKLTEYGGYIVVVGDTSINSADSRVEGKNQSPSELEIPKLNGELIITSVYNGVDYRNNAKLILDQDACAVTFINFKSDVKFENINIEHKYDPNDVNYWGTPMAISMNGNKLVVEDTVKVTAWNVAENAAGDWYPMIVGGHRFTTKGKDLKVNTNITIKGGNWDSVYAGCYGMGDNYPGNIDGNATVNVEGGYVGSIFGTTSVKYASGSISGKLEINVTGGTVDAIQVSQKNGADNEIVVNIAKTADRVKRVYGSSSEASAPSNITVNYDRSVIRDDEIFYCKTVNPSGSLADQPEKFMPTVYIAANGTGDGSSPDSPLGNAPGYDPFAFNEKKSSTAYTQNALYLAIKKLKDMGGRIVLVGPVSIDTAASRIESTGKGQAPSEFTLPVAGGEVVITSTFGGVDYAAKNGAKLILDQDKCCVTFLEFQCPVTFDKVTIEHRYDPNDTNGWGTPLAIAARGNKLVVEDTVKVTAWNTAKNMEGNWYPIILGGSRFTSFKANTDVTIKGGNWSAVYAGSFGMGASNPGNINGNATVNIMGGKIDTVFGTTDSKYASGKITGKLEINVTGGYVGAIFATQKNGAANEIVVNIAATAERVAKVWGGVSDASVPTNATVNYDRSVTRDDEVKFWTTVNATGNVEDQPEPVYFTLYVSNVEKGLGDGSSPENAIGHAEGYAKLRAKALAIIKANGGTNSKLSDANKSIVGSVYKQNALYRALSYGGGKLVKQGGKLVVCGTLSVDATDAMRKALADFWGPTGSAEVIITSYDGKTNFRAKGAKLVLDNSELGLCVELGSPTTFDNITIEHKYNSKNGKGLSNGAIIAGRGNKLTFGYNVKVIATDVNPDEEARIEMYPTILGGHRYSDSKSDCYVTVGSGQWAALIGGDYGAAHTGNATIGINGGKIGTVCGTTNPTNGNKKHIFNGSVWIGLWAGEVDNVYVVGKPGMIWGDASIGLGGTEVKGKVRATHPDYEGDEIQSWVFNYTDKQVDTKKVVGFENPVPATGSALPYLAVVATVSLVGAPALIVSKKKKAVKN